MMRRLCLISLSLALVTGANGQDDIQGQVRTGLDLESPQWIGQPARLNIEMLSTGFIFSNQKYAVPEVPGALVMQTSTSAVNLTERQGGETWQVLRYSMQIYPQRSGEIEIPAIEVSFSVSGGFGQDVHDFSFFTEELRFDAALPPGADPAIPVVVTDEFEMSQQWTPEPVDLLAGHALKRRVTMRADGVPGMVLPPSPGMDISGIAVYPADPKVTTASNRGQLSGERVEETDLVFEQPGNYEVPGFPVQWWRPSREELTLVEVEPLSIEVAPNPALQREEPAQGASATLTSRNWWWLALLMFVAAAAHQYGPAISVWIREWHRRRDDAEPAHFLRLEKACAANEARLAYKMLNRWFAKISADSRPVTLAELSELFPDESLAVELRVLQETVARSDSVWKGRKLAAALRRARKEINTGDRKKADYLPPLNPTSG